jgi:hypothetical protein
VLLVLLVLQSCVCAAHTVRCTQLCTCKGVLHQINLMDTGL